MTSLPPPLTNRTRSRPSVSTSRNSMSEQQLSNITLRHSKLERNADSERERERENRRNETREKEKQKE